MVTENALWYAENLLRQHRGEAAVRHDIQALLEVLGRDAVPEYKTGRGQADLHLRGDFVLVEVKGTGKADPDRPGSGVNETQAEQLARYVQALQDPQGLFAAPMPWRGLLTDGRLWWQYDFGAAGDVPVPTASRVFASGQESDLVAWLQEITARNAGKPWIPAQPAAIYQGLLEKLDGMYRSLETLERRRDTPRSLATKRALWLDMLRGSGMAPASPADEQHLFIRHTLLILIARAVVKVLAADDPLVAPSSAPPPPPAWTEDDLEGFAAWVQDALEGPDWLDSLLQTTARYDWRMEATDVLRNLYERLIRKADRKAYGEYYTPDWLAQMLVERILDTEWCDRAAIAVLAAEAPVPGIGLLDPTCGSGTFLYHAARHILRTATPLQDRHLTDAQRADLLVHLIHGLDIHPVAVEIARATLLRALPAQPARGSVALQVWQGDALLYDRQKAGLFGWQDDPLVLFSPQDQEIVLPQAFARHRGFAQNINRLVDAAKTNVPLPADLTHNRDAAYAEFMQRGYASLKSIIAREGNSVWAWWIRNAVAPRILADRKVDRIVANPPWVRMSDIQDRQRKKEMRAMAVSLQLWVGGNRATAFDIASLFIRRCTDLYLAENGRSAWLANWASTISGSWKQFRTWAEREGGLKMLDFSTVQEPPFQGAKSCAWLSDVDLPARNLLRHTERIGRHEDWARVQEITCLEPLPDPPPQAPSEYLDADRSTVPFRQGAILVPYVLVRLSIWQEVDDLCEFRTAPSRHGIWKELGPQTGTVPRDWVCSVVFPHDLLPFSIRTPASLCIIPLQPDGSWVAERGANAYWSRACELYALYCGLGTSTPQTLERQLDYFRKLSCQFPLSQHCVVYNASGKYLRAARVDQQLCDTSCYYWGAPSAEEACYLVSLLNASALQPVYAAARESDRHFHTHFWSKVPIPQYRADDPAHAALSGLAREAEAVAQAVAMQHHVDGTQKLCTRIWKAVGDAGIMAGIDELATAVIAEGHRTAHARRPRPSG